MRTPLRILVMAIVCWAFHSSATTHFVDLNSTNPVSPYLDWATAATNIQDAINSSGFNDTILVTNGIYQYGGDSYAGSNRVDLINRVTVQSVNGPAVTVIKGNQVAGTTNGATAMRCVYMRESSKLIGFTITGGATVNSGSASYFIGGGIAADNNCVISNCVIKANTSAGNGGGAYLGVGTALFNCILCGNFAFGGGEGGGAYTPTTASSRAALFNCVVSNNVAIRGGGLAWCSVYNSLLVKNSGGSAEGATLNNCTLTANVGIADGCKLNNSIIYYNITGNQADCYQCNLTNCCTPIGFGTPSLSNNSFSNAPGFVNPAAGDYHLNPFSRCIDTGNSALATNSVDLDGNPRIVGNSVDVGAYENQSSFQGVAHYVSLLSTNPVSPYTNWSTAATNLQDGIGAAQPGEFVIADDGVYTNSGTIMFGAETNRVVLTNGITLTSAGGPQAAIISGAMQTRCAYVGSNSILAGFTLANGRGRAGGDITNEQSGSGIWCEPGGVVSNCIVVGNTVLGGNPLGGGIYGGSVFNSIIYSNNASLGAGAALGSYFNCLFTNNASSYGNSGGGIYGGVASNCTFIGNGLFYGVIGGGAYHSTLFNCTFITNIGYYGGGGADSSTLYGCTLIGNRSTLSGGGGSHSSTNYNCIFVGNFANNGGAVNGGICSGCVLSNNVAQFEGGGSYQATLTNCVLAGNTATNSNAAGGGAYNGTVLNCLLVGNTAALSGGGVSQANIYNSTIVSNTAANGGGTLGGNIYNSIVYFNVAPTGSNYGGGNLFNCCTVPLTVSTFTSFTNDPLFLNVAAGDWHLQPTSLCINSGNNNFVNGPYKLTVDFDGNPRVIGTAVDIGAYEVQSPLSVLPYTWLWQYGIPIDASADTGDADGDGMSNYAEWRARTDPTNALSVLSLQPPVLTETNATITWQSKGIQYYVQSTPDLFAQPFQSIASNILGSAGTTSYTDTNAVGGVSLFYRVGVQ